MTDKEVLEDNYGDDAAVNGFPAAGRQTNNRNVKKFTNAYMLVYIKESEIDNVLKPFTPDDTPPHLSEPSFPIFVGGY